jgi:hypothetical protein
VNSSRFAIYRHCEIIRREALHKFSHRAHAFSLELPLVQQAQRRSCTSRTSSDYGIQIVESDIFRAVRLSSRLNSSFALHSNLAAEELP